MAQNQNNQQQFECNGNCIRCSVIQRQYCASQNTYNTMKMLEDLMRRQDELRVELDTIREEVKSIWKGSDDDAIFSTIAQKGSGAEIIDSQDNQLQTI